MPKGSKKPAKTIAEKPIGAGLPVKVTNPLVDPPVKGSITEAQLRAEINQGVRPTKIAAKYGISRQAVYAKIKSMGFHTVKNVTQQAEASQFVAQQITAMQELVRGLSRANLLQDACDEWLRDAGDPEKYNIGPRATEMVVTYERYLPETKRYVTEKSTLQALIHKINQEPNLSVLNVENKHADPRELILKTTAECRQTVELAVKLSRTLADMKAMDAYRKAILEEIEKVEPDSAERIREAIRRSLVLQGFMGEGAGN